MGRTSKSLSFAIGVVLWFSAVSSGFAETPQEQFDATFGDEWNRVVTTPDKKDDIELASKILKIMRESALEPLMVNLLCEKVTTLVGEDPAAAPLAIEALTIASRAMPDSRVAYLQRMVDFHTRRMRVATIADKPQVGEELVETLIQMAEAKVDRRDFDAAQQYFRQALGTAIQLKLPVAETVKLKQADADALKNVLAQASRLEDRLRSNPADQVAAKDLILLYLVELDDPGEAAKRLTASDDSELAQNIRLAEKGLAGLPPTSAVAMADWYRQLAEKASKRAKPCMLRKAKGYCERFLSLHPGEDLARAKAKADLERIDAALDALDKQNPGAATSSSLAGAVNLIAMVPTTGNGVIGTWIRSGQELRIEQASGVSVPKLTIPVNPNGDYEILLEAMRTTGTDSLGLGLPVGAGHVTLIVGGDKDTKTGLGNIDRKKFNVGSTATAITVFADKKRHTVAVQVLTRRDQAQIIVKIDGKQIIKWEGAQSALTPDSGMAPPNPRALCLSAWQSTYIFHKAQLRMISGKAVPIATAVQETKRP
jgi:hypothetical protein